MGGCRTKFPSCSGGGARGPAGPPGPAFVMQYIELASTGLNNSLTATGAWEVVGDTGGTFNLVTNNIITFTAPTTINIATTGTYEVDLVGSVTGTTGPTTLNYGVGINGADPTSAVPLASTTFATSGVTGLYSGSRMYTLNGGDTIQLFVEAGALAGAVDTISTVEQFNAYLIYTT